MSRNTNCTTVPAWSTSVCTTWHLVHDACSQLSLDIPPCRCMGATAMQAIYTAALDDGRPLNRWSWNSHFPASPHGPHMHPHHPGGRGPWQPLPRDGDLLQLTYPWLMPSHSQGQGDWVERSRGIAVAFQGTAIRCPHLGLSSTCAAPPPAAKRMGI